MCHACMNEMNPYAITKNVCYIVSMEIFIKLIYNFGFNVYKTIHCTYLININQMMMSELSS